MENQETKAPSSSQPETQEESNPNQNEEHLPSLRGISFSHLIQDQREEKPTGKKICVHSPFCWKPFAFIDL